MSLRRKFETILGSDGESLSELLSKSHKLFLATQVDSDPDESVACYPTEEPANSLGMAIEFQCVLCLDLNTNPLTSK